MVYLNLKSHLKLFTFNQKVGTLSSSNRIFRYFTIFCCIMYLTFFPCFAFSGIRGFINAESVRKIEQIYEVLPGFSIGTKILMLYPYHRQLESLLDAFEGIELSSERMTIMLVFVDKFKRYFKKLVFVSYSTCCSLVITGVVVQQLPFPNEGLPFIDVASLKMSDLMYWVILIHQAACLVYGSCMSMLMSGYPALVMVLIAGYLEGIALKLRNIGWMKELKRNQNQQELIKCAKMYQKTFE